MRLKIGVIGKIVIMIGVIAIVFTYILHKVDEVELSFTDKVALYVNRDVEVSTGEYLLYAASIIQSTEKEYGTDIWDDDIALDDGSKVKYEEYMKQKIVEQIRMTRLLCLKADDYGVTLSEEEKAGISTDAQEYLQSIDKFNVGNVGIDLSTVLSVYNDNALADKVYTAILNSVEKTSDMDEDEYNHKKLDHFKSEYTTICKQLSPKWTYEKYVNDEVLSTVSFARKDKQEEAVKENVTVKK